RIELKTWTGDVKAKIKSFYNAIEHVLQDTSLDIQKQEKLEHLKEMPEDVARNKSDLKYSDEVRNAYDDIYNALETLNKMNLTKFDDNNLLTIEVIDISSEWACSYLKNNTIDFLKWVFSENSVPSLNKWVESVESQKHCAQKILECLGEKQSLASKNYKLTNSSNFAVGDCLDIMFTIKISKNHLELLYVESS
ncbi:16344_t:CDS:2, partial [Dentiscutata heterogama]